MEENKETNVTHSWGKSADQEGFGMDRVAAEEFALQLLGVEACKSVMCQWVYASH